MKKLEGFVLLAVVAVGVAAISKAKLRNEGELALEQSTAFAKRVEAEQRFSESTGSSKNWLSAAECNRMGTPRYPVQKAIQETSKALFTVRLTDVVLIGETAHVEAEYFGIGECTFVPGIHLRAAATDEQVTELLVEGTGRFDEYLLAIDVTTTHPMGDDILVTGNLIDVEASDWRN